MKETKVRSKSSWSSQKKRESVSISTSIKDSHILEIKHFPDYSMLLPVSVMLLGSFLLVSLLVQVPLIYFPIPFLLLAIHFLYNNRPTNCIIDKELGQIDYFREGILGTAFGVQKIHCSVSEIKQLKMKRYRSRLSETFKIFLVLANGQRLPISSNKVGRSDCRRIANKLFRFLERDIPIKGIE